MDTIKLTKDVYDEIMYYVNKTSFEISGLGNVVIIDGIPVVNKIYLLDQENSSAETEMDGDSIAKLIYEHHIDNIEGELRFWWHSHVNMEVFWSGTDKSTINDLTENGWFIHGVFNKAYEYKFAYSNNDPFTVFMDDLTMEIDYENGEVGDELATLYELELEILEKQEKLIAKKCDKLFDKHVNIKTYQSYGNYNPNSFPYTGRSYNHHNPKKKEDIDGSIIDVSESQWKKKGSIIDEINEIMNDAPYSPTDDWENEFSLEMLGFDSDDIFLLSEIGVKTAEDYYIYEDDFGVDPLVAAKIQGEK